MTQLSLDAGTPVSISSRIRTLLKRWPVGSIAILIVLLVLGVFAPFLEPHNPDTPQIMKAHRPPVFLGGTWDYVLGTDDLGRDNLSRLISGARISLLVGFAVVLGAGSIGTVLALLAGYFGGIVDIIISRMTEVFVAVPFLLVAIAVVGAVGASTTNLVLTLIFMTWAGYARVLRAEVLRLRELEFVKLAKVAGCSNMRILFHHILPNIVNPLVILATLQLGATIVIEASLNFLGLGVPAPQATWGGMLAAGKNYIGFQDSLVIIPAIAIFLVVLSINLLGDWLRLRLDPRFRQL
ncbi:ABC transporter permease [Chelatococcus reniformis]|uniref:Peptide ABC transporter permease n=1 Tax=Chelatococcus reniformis TaxID=1494448 RepID=A0A916X7V8_9HYPH|nr:ABC transporter permease [Chelatococcus reniformis]GGC48417.1 peptide ABC transporter permease [Chelatococcus reniformis]